MAKADAVANAGAGEGNRASQVERGARPGKTLKLAAGDYLGENHRCGFQRLHLFLRIGAMRLVLHHQYAQRAPGAQDRHAQEGVVDFLARLGEIAEGGVRLRVRQVKRLRLGRDQADQALADLQRRQMHGLALQALGGIELQYAI